jgi:Lrp/AsnC family transcriptional regulator, leucine-responsive regulatory protein
MPPRFTLDEIDRQILQILQGDGRITNADLARRVGLSPPSVLQRVRKLEESGVINRYVAILDPATLGLTLTVVVFVSLSLHQDQPIEGFVEQAVRLPEVVECLHVSGDFDFMLKVRVADMRSYEQFIVNKLTKIGGVGKIQSCFVMASRKESTEVTLP